MTISLVYKTPDIPYDGNRIYLEKCRTQANIVLSLSRFPHMNNKLDLMNGFVCLFIDYQTLMYVVSPFTLYNALMHHIHIPHYSLSSWLDGRISCLLYIFRLRCSLSSYFIRLKLNQYLTVVHISLSSNRWDKFCPYLCIV